MNRIKWNESSLKELYREEILRKVERNGIIWPTTLLIFTLLFTYWDYAILKVDSIFYRSLAIVPLAVATLAKLLKASPRIILYTYRSWLIGGSAMMAGLCYMVFSQEVDSVTKYGTTLGYAVVLFIIILTSYDLSIYWIFIAILILLSISLIQILGPLEMVLLSNLYVAVVVGYFFLRNKYNRSYKLFKDKLIIEDLNQTLDDFARIASHDLRSPLGGIASQLERTEIKFERGKIEEGLETFRSIKKTVKFMDKLLLDILTYSRQSTLDEESVWVDLEETIRSVEDYLSEIISEKEAQIFVQGSMPEIFFSETRLYQVVQNLILNAIK